MSNKTKKVIVRILAILLALSLIVMSVGYLFYAFAVNSEEGFGCAYAADFFWGDTAISYRMDALEGLILEVQENYKDEVDLDTLFDGIYRGLFESLDDPWSEYFIYEGGVTAYHTDIEEPYVGIGITYTRQADGSYKVVATVPDSPADEAGILTGDYIEKVGNTSVSGLDTETVQAMIRGEEGTYVTLTVRRGSASLEFTLRRSTITANCVDYAMLDDGIGYIRIKNFSSNASFEFENAREILLEQGMTSLVLDLRGNGGGIVSEALTIADDLIRSGGRVITSFVQKGKTIETIYSTPNTIKSVKTVALVDGSTASASELLVAALKETGYATVVGETTFGKGVAQYAASGAKDSIYKLSSFYFLSPKGNSIDGKGVTPDYAVHSSGNLSDEQIALIGENLAPMTESKKYRAGETGLNVYAAQQRLQLLGYDVALTANMDEKTVAALKLIQSETGGFPYGGLDYFTMNSLSRLFSEWMYGSSEDLPLAKALELLK